MSNYERLKASLRSAPRSWLITGVAGFIGSNLLETLLQLDQRVIGLDNLQTGKRKNLDEVRGLVAPAQWERFKYIAGDIRDPAVCRQACAGVDAVVHQAALGSVPRSFEQPDIYHAVNVTGFLNMLEAARAAKVPRFVYASSSAVYGDDAAESKQEDRIGRPLSPYGANKLMNDIYAGVYGRVYGLATVGLRYFNVFGARQDPDGAYAAVIPKWLGGLLREEPVYINGDGETTRDFCPIANVVQANLLAATTNSPAAINEVYNVAVGERTSLNELFTLLQTSLRRARPALPDTKPVRREFRPGDVRHSLADIGKARRLLGYEPRCRVAEGVATSLEWYLRNVLPAKMETA